MDKMNCWECGGKYKYKMVDFSLYGVSLGKFKAKVCDKCVDKVFTEEVSNQIDAAAKKKGLWGLETRTKVGRVGNTLDIRISSKIANFAQLKKGEEVTVYPESKKRLIVDIA